MRTCRTLLVGSATAASLMLAFGPAAAGEPSGRAALLTVEGVVSVVETLPADSGEGITAVRLRMDEPESREIEVLLAPEEALRQCGFEIEAGDRLRARIFLSDDDIVEAHKVMNLSRGMMVRLRTVRRVPLWDTNGQWQGGPSRAQGGGQGGHRHRGGQGRR